MRVGIAGSRTYRHRDRVDRVVSEMPTETIVVTGGARGPDRWAEKAAKARGLEVWVFRPDWKKYGRRAGFLRNMEIASHIDFLIAFWDGESKGTKMTIDLARNRGIEVKIIHS